MGAFVLDQGSPIHVTGELIYSPQDGITLRIGRWSDRFHPPEPEREYAIIEGVIEGNRPCSVIQAFDVQVRTTDGYEEREIVGNAILLGECNDPAAPRYAHLNYESPGLTAFANPSGVKVDNDLLNRRATITAEPCQQIARAWGENRLVLSSNLDIPLRQAWNGIYSIIERPHLGVEFGTAVSLNEIWRLVAALDFFSCLCDGEFSGPPQLLLWDIGTKINDVWPAPTAELLLSQKWYRPSSGRNPRHRLFVLTQLGPDPLAIVANWLSLFPRVERLTAIFRAAVESLSVEEKFLYLAQALEGLHRSLDAAAALIDAEFERGIAAVRSAIPADLSSAAKEFFQSRIPGYNEPGFAMRLKQYGARIRDVMPDVLPDFTRDRNGIKKYRDGFSHALENDAEDVQDYLSKLSYYSDLLRAIFEFNLLANIGFTTELFHRIYHRNGQFYLLARRRSLLFGVDTTKQ